MIILDVGRSEQVTSDPINDQKDESPVSSTRQLLKRSLRVARAAHIRSFERKISLQMQSSLFLLGYSVCRSSFVDPFLRHIINLILFVFIFYY